MKIMKNEKRRRNVRRCLSVLLAAVMLLSVMSANGLVMTAYAEETEAITTFAELQSAVSNAAAGTESEPTVLTISGTIEATEGLSISGKHIKLTGGTLTCSGLSGHLLRVLGNGSLTLENITLDGTGHPQDKYLVYAYSGNLTINDGAVLENNSDSAVYLGGASVLTMNGGAIRNNSDTRSNGHGAAIFTPDDSTSARLTINIAGGSITGNHTGGSGGAIYITNYCNLNITGGEISGNTSDSDGGAVYINTTTTGNRDAVSITGGSIYNNTAGEGKVGANVYTRRDIVLGPDAYIPNGIFLYYISGETRKLLLTDMPKYEIEIDSLGEGANWYPVIKMQDGSEVNQETFEKFSIKGEAQSLVLNDDGIIYIGTAQKSGYPLDFTWVVWSGNAGRDVGVAGTQSGEGWEWDADTLTLKITEDFRAIAQGTTRGLSLPTGGVTLDIAEGKTLTVESPDWYALCCDGALTITGGGTVSTVSGYGYTGGIKTGEELNVSNVKLELRGDSNYLLYADTDMTLEDSEVLIISNQSEKPLGYGITAGDNLTIKNSRINVELNMDETCTASNKAANLCGIVTGDGNISISGSEVTVRTTNRSPDEKAYNYGIISFGGDISVSDNSRVIVTATDSPGTIGVAAVGQYQVDHSLVQSTATTSAEGGYALEMVSYGGFQLTNCAVLRGQKYTVDDEEGFEEGITVSDYDPTSPDSSPRGGTSIIGIPVDGIILNKSTLELTVGSNETLTAVIAPADATIQDIVWSSENEAVAVVGEDGTVTAVSAGTVTITVATADGEYTESCTVTVRRNNGVGSVTMEDWTYGGTASEPVCVSETNGTDAVTCQYKLQGADDSTYTETKPVDAGSYTVRAVFAENVSYSEVSAAADFTIFPKEVTAAVTAQSKAYDGTVDAVVSAVVETGVENETLTISGLRGTFDNADTGSDKTVTVDKSGVVYGGTAISSNYSVSFPETVRADITEAALDVRAEGFSGVYDGTGHGITVTASETDASVKYGTAEGVYDLDSLTYTDAGTYTVYYQVSRENYLTVTGSATVEIAKRPVTISGILAQDKTYDKTSEAALDYAEVSYDGIVDGDSLTVSAVGAFADVKAGADKKVTIHDITLGGADAENYILADSGQQAEAVASILPKELTVHVVIADKKYDGKNTAEITSAELSGVLEGDKVSLVNGVPVFTSTEAGENIEVQFTAFTLEGEDAENYSLTQPSGVTASIAENPAITPPPVIDLEPVNPPVVSVTEAQKSIMEGLDVSEATAEKILEMAAKYHISAKTLLTTEKAIRSLKLEEAEASAFAILRARSLEQTKTSVTLRWKKVSGADGYLIYGKKCVAEDSYRLLGDVSAKKSAFTQKKLKRATKYRYIVVAYQVVDGKQVSIAVSRIVHATTAGGKSGVAKSLKVNKSKVLLKAGKSFRVKATEINKTKKIQVHRAVRFESGNTKIASVNAKTGLIRARKKGTCTIFVYTQNGIYKQIKVTVK